jgi:hypothetical protein
MENIVKRKHVFRKIKFGIFFVSFICASIMAGILGYIRLKIIPYDIKHKLIIPAWMHGASIIIMIVWLIWAVSSLIVLVTLLSILMGDKY